MVLLIAILGVERERERERERDRERERERERERTEEKGVYVYWVHRIPCAIMRGWSLSWGSLEVQDSNPYLSYGFSPLSSVST
jgi:hypothetical protein